MRIHHVAVHTRDLERSVAFYGRAFGFRVRERGEFEGTRLAFLESGEPAAPLPGQPAGDALIELIQPAGDGEHGRGDGHRAEGVVSHLAFTVDDADAELRRLRAAGALPLDEAPIPIYNGGRIAFCEGPDGELLELFEPPRPASG